MHELSLMEDLVTTIEQSIGDARVLTVRLEIGRLSAVVPDALQFCFEICTQGTRLEGAGLEIRVIEGRAHCRSCDAEFELPTALARCGCGGIDLQILAGEELRLMELEVI